jgi:hypothetical protein
MMPQLALIAGGQMRARSRLEALRIQANRSRDCQLGSRITKLVSVPNREHLTRGPGKWASLVPAARNNPFRMPLSQKREDLNEVLAQILIETRKYIRYV